jgi:hypothetical protein
MNGAEAAQALLAARRTALAALELVPRAMRDTDEVLRARRLYDFALIGCKRVAEGKTWRP